MGQRSQIYVRIQKEDEKGNIQKDLVPMYYQWNYAERMVSRVASTAEWLKESAGYYFSSQNREKLEKILSTNFDMKDVVIPRNIFLELADLTDDDAKFPIGEELSSAIFGEQDNNDGQAYIDVYVKGDDVHVSYAFMKDSGQTIMTANEYMNWDLGGEEQYNWINDYMERDWTEELEYTLKNVKYLGSEATLMSEQELEQFINDNYDKQFCDRVADQYAQCSYDYYLNQCAKAVFVNAFEKGVMAHPEEVFVKALEVLREYQKNHGMGSLHTDLQKMKEEGKLDIEKEEQKESEIDPKEALKEVKEMFWKATGGSHNIVGFFDSITDEYGVKRYCTEYCARTNAFENDNDRFMAIQRNTGTWGGQPQFETDFEFSLVPYIKRVLSGEDKENIKRDLSADFQDRWMHTFHPDKLPKEPKHRYEAVFGKNSNQFWVYDNVKDRYIDPPKEILDMVKSVLYDYARAQDYLQDIINEEPDWLNDEEYTYDGDELDI